MREDFSALQYFTRLNELCMDYGDQTYCANWITCSVKSRLDYTVIPHILGICPLHV
jgi:hypothetical protein